MTHIYILPGMGADKRMYPTPWETLPNPHFIEWPGFRGEKTVSEIANRVTQENNIQTNSIIIGSSLGGIVACEIANQIETKKVILIGSAKDPSEISLFLQTIHPLVDFTPLAFIQALCGKYPSELMEMFHESDPEFIRSMSKAVFTWSSLHPENKTPVIRIHGKNDPVIPHPKFCDLTLPGGHLIAITHANECVEFIKTSLKT